MTEIKKTKYDWKVFLFLALGVVIIQVGYYVYIHNTIEGLDKQGQFGDMFGALTALFSGFAFAGMITAIVLQTKELSYQREELELTRSELTRTADAAQQQVEYFNNQKSREDLYRLISKLTDRINNNYNSNILHDGSSLHYVVSHGKDLNKDAEFKVFYNDANNSNTVTSTIVSYVVRDLYHLMCFLIEYEKVTDTGRKSTPFPMFYKKEYRDLVKTFYEINLISEELFIYYQI